jgi:peptidoglycan/LPS O-acetylase OafA/YrhL
MGISSAPYLWGLADWQEKKRINRPAWGLAGVLDLGFGGGAVVTAVTNQRTHWIGGGACTVALGVLAVVWLLGAPAI